MSGDPKHAAPTAPTLDSAQRRHLRGLAHPLKPIVFVGEAGISPAVVTALDEALTQHELVKVRLRQPENKKEAAQQLARGQRVGALRCRRAHRRAVPAQRRRAEDPASSSRLTVLAHGDSGVLTSARDA